MLRLYSILDEISESGYAADTAQYYKHALLEEKREAQAMENGKKKKKKPKRQES
jgi:hypothetical protein